MLTYSSTFAASAKLGGITDIMYMVISGIIITCRASPCYVLTQYFESSLGLSPGDSALFINGLQVDLDVSDAFTLVELLRSESNMMEGMHSLAEQYHLDSVVTQQLLKLDLRDSETMYAVDIRDPSVIVCRLLSYFHCHHHHHLNLSHLIDGFLLPGLIV